MWTLFGLALRTAHALRLHNDEINEDLPPFEREMRRRVWHNIRRLDIQVSLDRGTYPCLPGKQGMLYTYNNSPID